MTIETTKEELIDEFSMFEDWMERYEYMIELGKVTAGHARKILKLMTTSLKGAKVKCGFMLS